VINIQSVKNNKYFFSKKSVKKKIKIKNNNKQVKCKMIKIPHIKRIKYKKKTCFLKNLKIIFLPPL